VATEAFRLLAAKPAGLARQAGIDVTVGLVAVIALKGAPIGAYESVVPAPYSSYSDNQIACGSGGH
jgi:hypothetical protein